MLSAGLRLQVRFITKIYHPSVSMKANGQICQDVIEASWSPVLSAQNGMSNMCDCRLHHVVTGVRLCILHLCSSGKTARNDDQPSVRYGQIYSLPRSSFTIICYLFLMQAICARLLQIRLWSPRSANNIEHSPINSERQLSRGLRSTPSDSPSVRHSITDDVEATLRDPHASTAVISVPISLSMHVRKSSASVQG